MPVVTIPEISPRLVKPKLRGLKQFAMSIPTAIFGLWDDLVALWADPILTWGAEIQYPSNRPIIGWIKKLIPKIK